MKSVFVFDFQKSIVCQNLSFFQMRKKRKAPFLFKTSKMDSHRLNFWRYKKFSNLIQLAEKLNYTDMSLMDFSKSNFS